MNIGNIIPKEKPLNLSEKSKWTNPINNWHKGKPTEDGWYLVAYKCVHECKNKGKIEYHAMNIVTYEDGFKDFRGRASDDVWQAVAYQIIEPYKETE